MSVEEINKDLESVNAIQETFKRGEIDSRVPLLYLEEKTLLKTKKATLELSAIIALQTISSTKISIAKPAIKLVKNALVLLMLTAKSVRKVKQR